MVFVIIRRNDILSWDEILFESVSNRSAFHHMIGRSVSKLDPFQQHISNSLKKKLHIIITFWMVQNISQFGQSQDDMKEEHL